MILVLHTYIHPIIMIISSKMAQLGLEESFEVLVLEGPSMLKLQLKCPFDICGGYFFYSASTKSVGFTSLYLKNVLYCLLQPTPSVANMLSYNLVIS